MEEEKFSLLEDVKSIKVGNEMSVTLSMGIGYVGNDYTKNYEYSRMAIDLALGRGGDQVVVKTRDKISYFGGSNRQVDKSTRVKARVKALAAARNYDHPVTNSLSWDIRLQTLILLVRPLAFTVQPVSWQKGHRL